MITKGCLHFTLLSPRQATEKDLSFFSEIENDFARLFCAFYFLSVLLLLGKCRGIVFGPLFVYCNIAKFDITNYCFLTLFLFSSFFFFKLLQFYVWAQLNDAWRI